MEVYDASDGTMVHYTPVLRTLKNMLIHSHRARRRIVPRRWTRALPVPSST